MLLRDRGLVVFLLLALAVTMSGIAGVSAAARAVPANDLAANAEVVSSFPYSDVEPGVIDATTSASDPLAQATPTCSAGFPRLGSNSIWYQFTPPTSGLFDVNTNGSSNEGSSNALDTFIAVFTGTYPALTQVACDDDSGEGQASKIDDLSVDEETTYLIYVARWRSTPTNKNDTYVVNFDFESTGPSNFDLTSPADAASYTLPALPTTFQWAAAAYVDSYTFTINDGTSDIVTQIGLTGTTATLSGGEQALLVAGTYTWSITAVNADGNTVADNAPFSFIIRQQPGPFTLNAPANGADFILPSVPSSFSWAASPHADSYTFTVNNGLSDIISRSGLTAPDVTLTSDERLLLTRGGYTWSVTAHNDVGSTVAENAPLAFTIRQLPGPFTLNNPADASVYTYSTVPDTFGWTAASYADSYTLTISNGTSDVITKSGVPVTSIVLDVGEQALIVPGNYTWSVTALNVDGSTVASNGPFSFSVKLLPGPFSLILPADGSPYALPAVPTTFEWTPSSEADTYAFTINDGISDIISQTGLTGTSTTLSTAQQALLPAGTYTWSVIAENFDGKTVASNAPFSFSVKLLPGPFTLNAPADGASYMLPARPTMFEWTAASNADSYTLTINDGVSDIITKPGHAGLTAALDAGEQDLLGIGSYTWTVTAQNSEGSMAAANGPFAFTIEPERIERLINGSFEQSGFVSSQALGWTGKFLTAKDARICNNIKFPSVDGSCVFRFRQVLGADPTRKLSQTFDAPAWGNTGERLDFRLSASAKSLSIGARVVLKVKYTNLTKSKVKFVLPVGSYTGAAFSDSVDVVSRVSRVIVNLKPGTVTGSFWLDSMSLMWTQAVPREVTRTDSDVLPVPAAPSRFRGNN